MDFRIVIICIIVASFLFRMISLLFFEPKIKQLTFEKKFTKNEALVDKTLLFYKTQGKKYVMCNIPEVLAALPNTEQISFEDVLKDVEIRLQRTKGIRIFLCTLGCIGTFVYNIYCAIEVIGNWIIETFNLGIRINNVKFISFFGNKLSEKALTKYKDIYSKCWF